MSEGLAAVRHEVRASLTLTLGYLDVALGEAGGAQSDHLEVALRNAQHLRRLLEGLLFLADARERRLEPRGERVDLARVARRAVAGRRAEAAACEVRLTVAAPRAMLVRGDAEWLALLVDAVVAIGLGTAARGATVAVRLSRSDGRAHLATAGGAPPALAPALALAADVGRAVAHAHGGRWTGRGAELPGQAALAAVPAAR